MAAPDAGYDEVEDVLYVDVKIYRKKNRSTYFTMVDRDPATERPHGSYNDALWYCIRVVSSYYRSDE